MIPKRNDENDMERRQDWQHNERLDQIQDAIAKQTVVTAQLVTVAENQGKTIDKLESWAEGQNEKYHKMNMDIRETQINVNAWSTQMAEVKVEMKSISTSLQELITTGLKIKGGWMAITMIASVVMGLVAIAKAFGLI